MPSRDLAIGFFPAVYTLLNEAGAHPQQQCSSHRELLCKYLPSAHWPQLFSLVLPASLVLKALFPLNTLRAKSPNPAADQTACTAFE